MLTVKRKTTQKRVSLKFFHGGKFIGFRASGLSAYDNVDPHTVIRELVQNSLDASKERSVTRVVFEIEDVKTDSIPARSQYKKRLLAAIKTQRKKNNLEQAQSIVDGMKSSIDADTVSVLWVYDNGAGLDNNGMENLLGDGQSAKADEITAGSYGNGHMTSFPASEMRYVLYGGVNRKEGRIISGHTILATHNYQEQTFGEDGYLAKKIRANVEETPRIDFYTDSGVHLLRSKLDWVEKEFETGSVVGILGFNRFNQCRSDEDVLDVIEDVVATHFTPVIHDASMEVQLYVSDQLERTIDGDALGAILERRKSRQRRDRNSIGPSGRQVWDNWETLRSVPENIIETKLGKVRFHFRQMPRDAGSGTHLQLFRNGMWITNDLPRNRASDFSTVIPFNGVVLLEPDGAPDACKLVGEFEGPRHIAIDVTKYPRNSLKRKSIDEFFGELHQQILELVPTLDSEEHDPGFFSIEVAGEGIRKNTRARASGRGTPEPAPRRGPLSIDPGKGGRRNSRRTLRRVGRRIDAQITALRSAGGVRVRVKVLEDAQNAELRVVLANGSDETCDTPEPDQFMEIGKGAQLRGRPVRGYVRDNGDTRRAVLLGPVSANGDELDIWLPSRPVATGDLRIELVRRSADR